MSQPLTVMYFVHGHPSNLTSMSKKVPKENSVDIDTACDASRVLVKNYTVNSNMKF
jgi:hypothetical protein